MIHKLTIYRRSGGECITEETSDEPMEDFAEALVDEIDDREAGQWLLIGDVLIHRQNIEAVQIKTYDHSK